MYERPHKTTKVKLNGRIVNIDATIVPVICLLNDLDCTTHFCCQGDDDKEEAARGYISFPLSGLHRFCGLVFQKNAELSWEERHPAGNMITMYDANALDLCYLVKEHCWDFGFCGKVFHASLRLPVKDMLRFQELMLQLFRI